ncbi:galactose-1-epimerase [Haemophilus sputorum]|uniref:Aldose 1-epimerase n=1 Tax=Haemophilus sputorum TaxID=1078480 RepID=A0A369YJ50_9PAST|nr:galactose-1-epimerase [Haemophilus sputorum]RDE73903.1 galactose-1-epimerase [Haemophilus sputorum]
MQTFLLENDYLKITLSDFGASWLSCVVKHPSSDREILITTTPDRWQENSAYFGATIGRYANRIAHARYQLNQQQYQLAANNGENNLHGGKIGGSHVHWQVVNQQPQVVTFAYTFADGEEGFGSEVQATVTYRLHEKTVTIDYAAKANGATPLCLTNHAYFNLSGEKTITQHQLQLNAEQYLPVDATGIPNAPLTAVAGTGFDFRQPKLLGQDLLKDADQQAVKGYDHAFLIAKNNQNPTACLAVDDLRLTLETSYPAIQIYTGNWLAGQPDLNDGHYVDYAGVALEPEFFPNSPNQPELAQYGGISQANEPYQHYIHYNFDF